MRYILLILSVTLVLSSPGALALPSSGSLYLSILPNATRCVDIVLPDDVGYFQGKVDFLITTDIEQGWADLTEQRVSTDENNTAIIPLCFYTEGREKGICSGEFRLSVRTPAVYKVWNSGVCITGFEDIDSGFGEPEKVLNSRADVFDIGLKQKDTVSSEERVEVVVLLESYFPMELEVFIEGLATQPEVHRVSLSRENPFREITFLAEVPGERTDFKAKARILECGLELCEKEVIGTISAGDRKGFSLTLFPENINIQNRRPVKFSANVLNFDRTRDFKLELIKPTEVASTFTSAAFALAAGEVREVNFTVLTPERPDLYEIKMSLVSEGTAKQKSAYISFLELNTDVQRVLESNPSQPAKQAVEQWEKQDTENLEEYYRLRERLEKPDVVVNETIPKSESGDYNFTWVIILAFAAVAIGILVFMFFRKPEPEPALF